jgi:8-oxo-dGTP diphosphatase
MYLPKKQFDKLFKIVPRLTVDAAIVKNGKILLIERTQPPFKGMVCLPGGFVDYGETVEQAVVREVFEETHIRAKIVKLLGVYSDPKRDPRGHAVTVGFLLKPVSGKPLGSEETRNVAFHDINRIPKLGFDHDKIVVDAKKFLKTRK